jgi:hypothetical protein
MPNLPPYLLPDHLNSPCCKKTEPCSGCAEAVKAAPSGRWYITMGHPGFNLPQNNGKGWASRGGALKALTKLALAASMRKMLAQEGK